MKEKKEVVLGIVKDPVVLYSTVSFEEHNYELRRAASNMCNNPQANFDRGVAAMIKAYQEIGPFDYVAVIGRCSLADIVLSSQCFFCEEVEKNFLAAGIYVRVEQVAATSRSFWNEEVLQPIERKAEMELQDMKFKSCQVSKDKAYRYYFDGFNYDENVVVYKLIPR